MISEESPMSNLHTTLFWNSFVLVSWSYSPLVPLWSIINIFLIFLFLFVIIFTYLQLLIKRFHRICSPQNRSLCCLHVSAVQNSYENFLWSSICGLKKLTLRSVMWYYCIYFEKKTEIKYASIRPMKIINRLELPPLINVYFTFCCIYW